MGRGRVLSTGPGLGRVSGVSRPWAAPGRAVPAALVVSLKPASLLVCFHKLIKKKCVCVGESKYTVQINFSRNFILSRALFTLHPPTPPNHVGHAVLPERSSFRSGLNGWFKMKSRGEGGHL